MPADLAVLLAFQSKPRPTSFLIEERRHCVLRQDTSWLSQTHKMTRCRLRLPIILALPLLVMLLVMLVYSKLHLLLIWHSQLIQQMGWSNGSAFWNFGLVNLGKK